jgi:peptidoglycan/LPS O-acetylase OafA/YrhL
VSGLTSVTEGAALSHPRPELLAVTGLRGLAGLAVVASTVGVWRGAPGYLQDSVSVVASAGVLFFFLLSGYVLAYNYPALSYTSGRHVIGRYAMARIARIVPLFAVVGLTVLLLGALNGGDWVRAVYADQTWFVGTLVLLYTAYPVLARPVAAAPLIAAICAVVLAAALLVLGLDRFPLTWLPVFVLGMAVATRQLPAPRWLAFPFLVRLGVIGYPLFLVQSLVIHGFGPVHAGTISNALLALCWIGLTVLIAEGAHRYVGVPARRAVLDLARRSARL